MWVFRSVTPSCNVFSCIVNISLYFSIKNPYLYPLSLLLLVYSFWWLFFLCSEYFLYRFLAYYTVRRVILIVRFFSKGLLFKTLNHLDNNKSMNTARQCCCWFSNPRVCISYCDLKSVLFCVALKESGILIILFINFLLTFYFINVIFKMYCHFAEKSCD